MWCWRRMKKISWTNHLKMIYESTPKIFRTGAAICTAVVVALSTGRVVGLPCLVSQCAKLHAAGCTWAVSTRVYLDSCISLSLQSGNFWIHPRITKIHERNEHPTYNKTKKANWTGHIGRRNCLLKHVIEGNVEGRTRVTGRRGSRRKQLLNGLKEPGRYWKQKD
jgi:hypothetical protein